MAKYTLIHFYSEEYDLDFYAVAPEGSDMNESLEIANEIIVQANHEDNENEGGTNDGKTVQEYIIDRLSKLGFSFEGKDMKIAVTKNWDEYHGKPKDSVLKKSTQKIVKLKLNGA